MLGQFGLVETKAKSVGVGEKFGRLTVIAIGQIPGTYRYFAVCECACGSEPKSIRMDGLTNGNVVSCGCVQRERVTTHALSKSNHYHRWRGIMDRCYNTKCKPYQNYGGRGVRVCNEWHTIEGFVAGLPEGYSEGFEIDRYPNNDGDYEPGNVRWATPSENSDNRRSGRLICFNGKTQSLRRWAEETGIHETTIWGRLERWNWPIDKALSTPPVPAKARMRMAIEARWSGREKKPKV